MKRFHWPLQRLLDVTGQREQVQRAELLAVSRRIARLRQHVLVGRASIRGLIAQLAEAGLPERMRRHDEAMRSAEAHERRIARRVASLAALADERAARTRELLKTRKKRETLERLREEARQQHVREQLKMEQREFDETAHVGRARTMIAARKAAAEAP